MTKKQPDDPRKFLLFLARKIASTPSSLLNPAITGSSVSLTLNETLLVHKAQKQGDWHLKIDNLPPYLSNNRGIINVTEDWLLHYIVDDIDQYYWSVLTSSHGILRDKLALNDNAVLAVNMLVAVINKKFIM